MRVTLAPAPTPVTESVLSLRAASFGYGDRPVLADANLLVRPGEVVAVLGPNGAGKSTLMKGILGLNELVSGSVTLFGVPSTELHDRARVGYVPQRHTLSASVRATVEEIVSSGRLPRLGWLGRMRGTDRQNVARALDVVGLADRATTEVSTLSGGQQRRVLIPRALAAQPDVLIMDEPTAGLDAANQRVLTAVLERLADRDVTMIGRCGRDCSPWPTTRSTRGLSGCRFSPSTSYWRCSPRPRSSSPCASSACC